MARLPRTSACSRADAETRRQAKEKKGGDDCGRFHVDDKVQELDRTRFMVKQTAGTCKAGGWSRASEVNCYSISDITPAPISLVSEIQLVV
jgi:hypothetical protein